MASSVADVIVSILKASGVRRVYGIPGDSLNGFTDALRRDGAISWQHDPATTDRVAAAFAGRLQDLTSNHSPKFLPPLQPTLRTGTEALVAAALAWLAPDGS